MAKEIVKDEQLDNVAGGNIGYTNPNGDNTGDFWVFYYVNGEKKEYTDRLHCTDLTYCLQYREENKMFMTDIQIFNQLKSDGYLIEK